MCCKSSASFIISQIHLLGDLCSFVTVVDRRKTAPLFPQTTPLTSHLPYVKSAKYKIYYFTSADVCSIPSSTVSFRGPYCWLIAVTIPLYHDSLGLPKGHCFHIFLGNLVSEILFRRTNHPPPLLHYITAVSYTHLDVYKRQVKGRGSLSATFYVLKRVIFL